MILVKTNINQVAQQISTGLKKLENPDVMLRTAATTVLALMKERIHEQGLDANGHPIGTYSRAYMKVRTGGYGNAKKFSKGKNAGKLKNAGVFSKGSNTGASRPRYNRDSSTKVILSLTRQMENDMRVIATGPNAYGIGYSNPLNFNKSQWNEATYNLRGKIFSLSKTEITAVQIIAEKFVNDALSG